MTEPAQKPPKQRDLSGPLHRHLGEFTKPEVVAVGHQPLGKAEVYEKESNPNPPAPPKGPSPPKTLPA